MHFRDKDKKLLIDNFFKINVPLEVWVYGSRANGTSHEGSDIDLVIRGNELDKFPKKVYYALKNSIQKSNIPIMVDLFEWHILPDTFKQNILQNHEVLYSNMNGV
ncbi:MAG: nucleotidyltransferase domain-containing protein [Cytophagales bacterium]|nr:nucleotidyltransferase domain-containing protein [Cytophagales bacterium]